MSAATQRVRWEPAPVFEGDDTVRATLVGATAYVQSLQLDVGRPLVYEARVRFGYWCAMARFTSARAAKRHAAQLARRLAAGAT